MLIMADSSTTGNSWQGYIVCCFAFIINVFVMGIADSFGIVLPALLDQFMAGRTLTGTTINIVKHDQKSRTWRLPLLG